MRAEWFCAVGGILVEVDGFSLCKTVFFAADLKIDNISRYDKRNENGQAVNFCDGFSFCCDVSDSYVLE